MGVKKDPRTGEVIEIETKRLDDVTGVKPPPGRRSRGRGAASTTPLADPVGSARPRRGGSSAFEAETKPVDAPGRRKQAADGPQTQRYRPGSDTSARARASGADDALKEAVVGWLVVVDGPGKGQVCQLGYGVNSMGRGGKSRVRLDFGDEEISREDHATVTYDPKGRKYYLQHGGGINLTYLDDEPVLAPTPLHALRHIVLGGTTLRFVPLCGPEFDWQDLG